MPPHFEVPPPPLNEHHRRTGVSRFAAEPMVMYMGWRGYELSPNIVFALLAVFNALQMPLITMPLNLAQLASFAVLAAQVEKNTERRFRGGKCCLQTKEFVKEIIDNYSIVLFNPVYIAVLKNLNNMVDFYLSTLFEEKDTLLPC